MFAKTLHQTLDAVAAERPGIPVEFPSERRTITLAQLVDASVRAGAALTHAGVRAGDRIGMLCPNEPGFLVALFAAARLGCAVCPLPVPTGPKDIDAYLARLRRVGAVAGMRHLVLSPGFEAFSGVLADALPGVRQLSSDAEPPAAVDRDPAEVTPDTPVIIQFTSGSTAAPKGVVLSHENILACLEAISVGIGLGTEDSLGMWLPLFHDMGLFATLSALFAGIPATVWSPASFVKRPDRWLREFAGRGATISAAPDFGYTYLTAAFTDREAAGLDLSRWRIAFNGAETIRRDNVDAFLERFGPAGFRAEAMVTVYGMAEATLAVTFPPLGRPPRWHSVDRDRLADEGRAVPVARDAPGARSVAGVGAPVRGMRVRVGADGPLPDGQVGEILIQGASVTRGYLATDDVVQPFTADGWLRTGDLGFLLDGELYITGRAKEMIIVRGDNYYPQDVEDLARTVPGVYKQRCVAYADRTADRTECMALTAESDLTDEAARLGLQRRLRERISAGLGLDAVVVHLVPPRTLPRTTSGKFQRLAAKQATAQALA